MKREPRQDVYARIFDVVRRIPRGRVATYGQVAAYADIPRGARLVGWALRTSTPPGYPWWRVINAQGGISLTGLPGEEQRSRLAAEGIEFERGRVDLKRYLWLPAGDL